VKETHVGNRMGACQKNIWLDAYLSILQLVLPIQASPRLNILVVRKCRNAMLCVFLFCGRRTREGGRWWRIQQTKTLPFKITHTTIETTTPLPAFIQPPHHTNRPLHILLSRISPPILTPKPQTHTHTGTFPLLPFASLLLQPNRLKSSSTPTLPSTHTLHKNTHTHTPQQQATNNNVHLLPQHLLLLLYALGRTTTTPTNRRSHQGGMDSGAKEGVHTLGEFTPEAARAGGD
jgi:hypothetical protein